MVATELIRIYKAACYSILIWCAACSSAPGQSSTYEKFKEKLLRSKGLERAIVVADMLESELFQISEEDRKLCNQSLEFLNTNPDKALELRILTSLSSIVLEHGENENGLSYAKRAKHIATELKNESAIAEANFLEAKALFHLAKFDESLIAVRKAKKMYLRLKDDANYSLTLSLLGSLHWRLGNGDMAINCHFEDLKNSESSNDTWGIVRARNNIGTIYWKLGKLDEANKYLETVVDAYRKANNQFHLLVSLCNLGLVLKSLKQFDEAIPKFLEALEIAKSLGSTRNEARILTNIGLMYEDSGNDKKATEYLRMALDKFNSMGESSEIAHVQSALGRINVRAGKQELGIDEIKQSIAIAEKTNNKVELVQFLRNLAMRYEENGNVKKAFETYKRYKTVELEVNLAKLKNQVTELESVRRLAITERTVEKLKHDQVQDALLNTRRSKQYWMVISGLLICTIVVTILFTLLILRSQKLKRQSFTELQRALQKLNDSELRYRTVFEDAILPKFLICPKEKKIVDANSQAAYLCGVSCENLRGRNFDDATPEWMARFLREIDVPYDSGAISGQGYLDNRLTEFHIVPIQFANQYRLLLTLHDNNENSQTEMERIRLEKLESLGLVAGGIAHDFNNTLAAVLGLVSIARLKTDSTSEIKQILVRAEDAALQAESLTMQLLNFAKNETPSFKPQDAEKLIREVVDFSLAGSGTETVFDFDSQLWKINVDEGQFKQAICNLVLNANEAMKDRGKLTISCRNVYCSTKLSSNAGPGPYVLIEITDDGPGISPKLLQKVFEPYFTTKTNGSGLGLPTTNSIVRQHNGCLQVKSEAGLGTTFYLYFRPAYGQFEGNVSRSERTIYGTGSILVMDDDPFVQDAYREALLELGYKVEIVSNGEQAIAKWTDARNSQQPFDVIILDLTVPGGMGGEEAMAKLLQQDSGTVGVVATGYLQDPAYTNFRSSGFQAKLKKPFSINALGEMLQSVIVKS